MDLVILAGGMGSRFGGDKQATNIDSHGNFIMDYSIHDAIKAGFDKIVVIIKPNLLDMCKKKYAYLAKKGKIEFAIQSNDDVLALKKFGINREKPLGTAHAILCAKPFVHENFCIVNADDFYGKSSYQTAYNFLKKADPNSMNFALVGYKLENTLSENGAVKRGVCELKNGFVESITESKISVQNGKVQIVRLLDGEQIAYHKDMLVSMNMFCLTPKVFEYLEKGFDEFCSSKENLQNKEFLIPEVLGNLCLQNKATMWILKTHEKWIGMTYKEDLPKVRRELEQLSSQEEYPENLF